MVETIRFGVPVTGQVDSISPTDNYNFNANRGDKLWVSLKGYNGMNLFDPNDRLIAGGSSLDETLGPLTANLTGTYTLSVGDPIYGDYGNYWLTVQRINRPGNATAIAFGSTVPVNIDNYEQDTYTFVGRANTKISIGLSGGIGPTVSFFAPDGSPIETFADPSNSIISNKSLATLTQDGTYTLLISGGLNETYDLKVSNLGTPRGISLNGTSSDDYLEGDYGYDTINGLAGNDNLRGNHGHDRLLGGDGNDTLYGRPGNDRLLGGNGNDYLYGGSGKDILNGGKGDDVLIGDEDPFFYRLRTFQEQDKFVFDTGRKFQRSDIGIDTIQQFDRFSDKIVLDKTTFTSLNSVAGRGFSVISEFAVVKTDSAASTSQAEIVYNSANGKLFYNPNRASSGYGEGGFFALLTGTPTLGRGNFILQA